MKVAELEGTALDYWVARAEGVAEPWLSGIRDGKESRFDYSTNWAQGGPIIQRERITIAQYRDRIEACKNAVHGYDGLEGDNEQEGPTPLIAAMRCFVSSKFGEEVPDDVTLNWKCTAKFDGGEERVTYGTSTITDPEAKKVSNAALEHSMKKTPE